MTNPGPEAENTRLREANAAMRDLLAAIAGALPPYPADAADMGLYDRAFHDRAKGALIAANVIMQEERTPAFIGGVAAGLRRDNTRPLSYEPEDDQSHAEPEPEPAPRLDDTAYLPCSRHGGGEGAQGRDCPECRAERAAARAGGEHTYPDVSGGGVPYPEPCGSRYGIETGNWRCTMQPKGHTGLHRDGSVTWTAKDAEEPPPDVVTAEIYCGEVSTVGTACNGLDGHPLPHKDARGFEWGEQPHWCPAWLPGEDGEIPWYCELPAGHPGDHAAPGAEESDPDITWPQAAPGSHPAIENGTDPFGPEAYKQHSPGCQCWDCKAYREEARGRM